MDFPTLPMSAALASRPPIISDCDVDTAPRRAVLALDLGTTTGWALRLNTGGTVSGVMTFMVNHDGVVYEKDLGAATPESARRVTRFDPDGSWKRID